MPALLGIYGRKEYYLSDPDPKTGEQQIVWRVPDIREAVRARPGWKLLGADYSQIEIRLMADASGDPWLIQALNSGKDVHCYLTADAYGISYDEFFYGYKHENDPNHWQFCTMRNDFKQVSFGVPYGAKAPLIAAKTGKPMDEAQGLIDRFFAKACVLKVWLDDQGRMAIRYGFSSSARGRKRFYRTPAFSDPERESKLDQIGRWAGNQPIQCLPGTVRIFEKSLGYVPIQDLAGKKVEVWDGHRFVKAGVVRSGKKRLARLKFMNGVAMESSPEHKFSVLTTKNRKVWKQAKELGGRNRKNLRVELTDPVPAWSLRFEIDPAPKSGSNHCRDVDIRSLTNHRELGEFLGRLASDGTVTFQEVRLLVAQHEKCLLGPLRRLCGRIGVVKEEMTVKGDYQPIYRLTLWSRSLARQMRKLKVKQQIPWFVWKDSVLLRAYLRGFFDGDGTVCRDSAILTFGKKPENVARAREIQEALLLLGVRSRVRHYPGDRTVVQVQKFDMPEFTKLVGFLNPVKQEKAERVVGQACKGVAKYGRGVSPRKLEITHEQVEMFDVVNSESGQFMAGGVVVHNSGCVDLLKPALSKIYLRLRGGDWTAPPRYGARILFCVHDEIVTTAPEKHVEEVSEIMKVCMQEAYDDVIKSVKNTVDVTVGDYWKK